MSRGLTLEQMEFLVSKGVSAEEMVAFAKMGGGDAAAERSARYRSRMDVSADEWIKLRDYVLSRDGFACTYCGAREDLTCDHVIPLIRGGLSVPSNLTTACRPCNGGKSWRTPEEWLANGD